MNGVIGDVFPIAFGIAASPIPISAVVLLMLGDRPMRNGVMFILGWFVGVGLPASLIAVAVTQVVQLAPVNTHRALLGSLLILLGLVCGFFAWRLFRTRPHPGERAAEPKWMRTMTGARPLRAFALGIALSGLNPEDLMLALSGGTVIGGAHLAWGTTIAALVVFVLISSLTVIAPPVIFALGGARSREGLERAREWLVQNNAVLMSALLFVIGAAVVGHGIKAF